MVRDRIDRLRAAMKKSGIDYYLVPTSDFHSSEYVSDFFKCREYMSGFDGSAGTLVVSEHEAGLWTDGRYFIQAEEQLKGTGIKLYKSGNEGVPDIKEYLRKENIDRFSGNGITIGFDGRCMQISTIKEYEDNISNIRIVSDVDLVGSIWDSRPAFPADPIYIFKEEFAGCSPADKIAEIGRRFREKECDYHLISSLDDIAWILNLRGSDIACNPVFLSYLLFSEEDSVLFCNKASVGTDIEKYLENFGVRVMAYNEAFTYCRDIVKNRSDRKEKLLLDPDTTNYRMYKVLSENFEIVLGENPSRQMKAVKNEKEIENLKEANVIDGVAMVKFLKWLDEYKNNPGYPDVTELGAADMLLRFRKESSEFIDISFETIAAYGEHAAIVHYEPTSETDITVERKGFLLVDSGAQYFKGTTDITRTIAMGALTDDMKKYYTAVLRGNLNLASAVFPSGVAGANLDILARGPLWKLEKDYNHGTGHGIGFFLNVHEGPQNINWKIGKRHGNEVPLVCGMVISDEPGFYLEGAFGIRTENDVTVVKRCENDYDTFLGFEILTLAPIDMTPVIWEDMTEEEISVLNEYHRKVYEKLSPYLDADTAKWLKEHTKPFIKE